VYKLRIPTIGIRDENGKWVTIKMPANAVLEVAGQDPAKGTVDVIWNEIRIRMFAIDLKERGDALERQTQYAAASAGHRAN